MYRVPQLFCHTLQGKPLVWLASTTAGCGFLLFGYDQGVMSGLLTLPSFLDVFPEVRDANVSGITVSIYEIGCLFGAVFAICYGDRLGRKTSIMLGMTVMIIGCIIMTSSYSLAQFIVGRIVCGLGNGLNTATIPSLQGELSPPAIRGSLILVSGALITVGLTISYFVGLGFFFVDSSASWRFPIAFQMVFAFLCMGLLFAIPESPAWLLKHGDQSGYVDEARLILAKISKVEPNDEAVSAQVDATQRANAEVAAFQFKDLFTHGPTQNFRRAAISFTCQMFQQITGINLISYYAATLFETSIGLSPFMSRLLAALTGVEYFLAAFATVTFVDRLGRRLTMVWGAIGCGMCFVALTVLVRFADQGNQSCAWAAVAFFFLFNTSFAFGWLGQGWLYPAELTSLPIRAQANGVSTVANWLFNFVVVEVVPPGFANIGHWLYLCFAAINLLVIAPVVYFFFPETTGRSLEELDLIFAEAYADPSLGGYIKHSKTRPRISGRELDVELAAALNAGKMRAAGDAEHIEHAARQPKRRGLRRLNSEKATRLGETRTDASSETSLGNGQDEKKNGGEIVMKEHV